MLFSFLVFTPAAHALENTSPVQTPARHQGKAAANPLEGIEQTFTKTVHGGFQHVVVKSVKSASQIKLLQTQLMNMVEQFQNGDFSQSERLYGVDMPGLAELKRAEANEIKFEYQPLANGGQIHYSSEEPQLVQALHEWFTVQKQSHGEAVIPYHALHHATAAE